ncbi:hypothetical protein FVE85_4649 [Porphyridium purpureum]|uniref:Uncharacterized protein n=1 Tax=Porphyridium purpureum TaxID=35688 RepID=A0A5J4YRS5_PORPP|nr:hypothetical protein FVE85_4649 [Porphyridium purpureum]|eukprot:POR0460..scf236_6
MARMSALGTPHGRAPRVHTMCAQNAGRHSCAAVNEIRFKCLDHSAPPPCTRAPRLRSSLESIQEADEDAASEHAAAGRMEDADEQAFGQLLRSCSARLEASEILMHDVLGEQGASSETLL